MRPAERKTSAIPDTEATDDHSPRYGVLHRTARIDVRT